MSVDLMRRFNKLIKLPFGRRKIRRAVALSIMQYPRLFIALYPILRYFAPLPRLR